MNSFLKFLQSTLREYLRFFATWQIRKFRLLSFLFRRQFTVVGITGSAGKTSTVAACQAALQDHYYVKSNQNYNSQYGLPANILGFKLDSYSPIFWLKVALLAPLSLLFSWDFPEIYLVEMDVDGPQKPHNISYLLSIIKPDIAIHLNVSTVHTQNFDPLTHPNLTSQKRQQTVLRLMAKEQAQLVYALKPSQTAFLNLNDPQIAAYSRSLTCQVVPIQPYPLSKLKLSQKYIFPDIYQITFGVALMLADYFKIPPKSALTSLQKNFSLAPSRSSLFQGIFQSRVIDSSYNASPEPMREFLTLLSRQKGPKIAILGDMREMGLQTELEHRDLAPHALASADLILTVGPEMQRYFPDHPKIQKFLYWWQALNYLKSNSKLINKANILIKGSQNTIYLEEIVKGLLSNKNDSKFLCRQSKFWLKIKKIFRLKNQTS